MLNDNNSSYKLLNYNKNNNNNENNTNIINSVNKAVINSYKSNKLNITYPDIKTEFFESLKTNNKQPILKIIRDSNNKPWEYEEYDTKDNGLHILAIRGFVNLFKTIITEIHEKYIDNNYKQIISNWINKCNKKGDTALHYLSYKGSINLIMYLSNNFQLKPEITNSQGNTVLHYAAQGNQPCAFIFFTHKYNNILNPVQQNNDGCTPLHWACYMGSEHAMDYILKYFSDINIKDKDGLTPLHLAVLSDRSTMVKKLLYKGACKLIKDNKLRTPKMLAEEKGKFIIASMLEDKVTCSLLTIKNPLKKIEKSYFNVYIYFIVLIFVCFVYLFIVLPSKIYKYYIINY